MGTGDVEDLIKKLSQGNPGYQNLISQIASLVTAHPPPFLYINDPTTPRTAASVLKSLLLECAKLPASAAPQVRCACVDVVACFTARVFYDTVLNALARWAVRWEDGCENWPGDGSAQGWNESVDGFLNGLRAIYEDMDAEQSVVGKGKGKEDATRRGGDRRMVLVVERAERLKEALPDLVVPLTRLAEMVSPNSNLFCTSFALYPSLWAFSRRHK
jgi:origin recognition complex subunit 5